MTSSPSDANTTHGSSAHSAKSEKRWGVVVFGLIFFSVGLLVAAITAGNPIKHYFESKSWVIVPVTITHLELNAHHGDDSVTWNVDARYQYQFNGRIYHSDSVSLSSGSDNIGNYWQLLHARLSMDKQNNQAHAYVNPDDPQRAYLDRSLRPEMLLFGGVFAAIFMFAGGGVMYLGLRTPKTAGGDGQTSASIASDQRGGYKILLAVGIIFILISLPVLLIIKEELQKGEWGVLLTLLFPLLGSGAVFFALRMRKRYLQIGPTPFYPDPMPGYAGGQVGGYFHLARGEWIKSPQIHLTCTHIYSTRQGKESRTHHDILWQSKGHAHCEQNNNGCDVHAVFDVPDDLPGSGSQSGYSGRIQWSLHCVGSISIAVSTTHNPRVDNSRAMRSSHHETVEFERSWIIPVEKGLRTSSFQIPSSRREAWHQQQREEARESAAAQINLAVQGESLHLNSQHGRHRGIALGMVLFGAVFDGFGLFMLSLAFKGEAMLWFMGPLFLLVGLLVTGLGVFWLGRGLEADVTPGRVQMVRRLFGLPLYQRSGTVTSASQVQLAIGLSSTNQHGVSTEYYTLWVDAGGKKIKLAEGIEGREAAAALKEQVVALLTRELDAELV